MSGPSAIRRLTPADWAIYRDIRLESLREIPQAFASTLAREHDKPQSWFEERIAQSVIFGAFAGEELLGVVGVRRQEGPKTEHKAVLWGMYVRLKARNDGLGMHLVEAVIIHARGRVEQLLLSVVSENEAALRLYRRAGFAEYGREENAMKQDGRYYDEILMVKFMAP